MTTRYKGCGKDHRRGDCSPRPPTPSDRTEPSFFDSILAKSVQSSYFEGYYRNQDERKTALSESSVRLQWDPDHDPAGAKIP
jgi:hypothetical protein